MTTADFPRQTVEILAKRAANCCSNPDCQALTCGPAEENDKALTIGEAAHIFGARVGAARYLELMTDGERGEITNGIWLCRNCHKIVDADPSRFPGEILFEWRREREGAAAKQLGKPSELIRHKVVAREMAELAGASYMAQQIIIDKPEYWEYKLLVELLRSHLGPVRDRWKALERGLYARKPELVPLEAFADWNSLRMREVSDLVEAFSGLVSQEVLAALGPPGVPANIAKLLEVSQLLAEMAKGLLAWEETVRFAVLPTEFDELHNHIQGIAGRHIEELWRLPTEITASYENSIPGGHEIALKLDLPPGWADKAKILIEEGFRAVQQKL